MADDMTDGGNSIMMIRHKVVFVGDVSVGKTSVMLRFIENKFKDTYDPTIGVDFYSKSLNFRDNTLKLQIWDSAGQERYKSLIPSYVRGASIIFILYDISRKETFDNVQNWINFIKNVKVENGIIVLLGNKLDLERKVSTAEGSKLAEKEGLLFFEISAKTNDNLLNMFYSTIVELPFFEQFEINNKQKIIEELGNCLVKYFLVNENRGEAENSMLDIIKNNSKRDIEVKNAKKDPQNSSRGGCKC